MQTAVLGWAMILVGAWIIVPPIAILYEWWQWLYQMSDWPRIKFEQRERERVEQVTAQLRALGYENVQVRISYDWD